jgi:hypothetical protein
MRTLGARGMQVISTLHPFFPALLLCAAHFSAAFVKLRCFWRYPAADTCVDFLLRPFLRAFLSRAATYN